MRPIDFKILKRGKEDLTVRKKTGGFWRILPSPVRTHLTFRVVIWCSFFGVGVAVLLIGLTVWTLRSDAIRDAANDSKNIATVLAAQTAQSMKAIDVVLNDILSHIQLSDIEDVASFKNSLSDAQTSKFLRLQNSKLPQSEVVALADHSGRVVSTSRQWPTPDIDVSDREHFKYFQNVNDANTFVGSLVSSRASNRPIIFFSKRITSSGGDFLGIVFVGLDPSYFASVYQSIKSLWMQSFELVREDGSILVRYPEALPMKSSVPRTSPWYWAALQGGDDYYEIGESRFVSATRVAYTPLFVNVAVSELAALQHWKWRTFLIAIGTLIAIACPIALLVLLKRQFGELLKSEASLEENVELLGVLNNRLDLAFNNMSQGLCFFDGQQRLIVCNRRFVEMYNLKNEEVHPGLKLEQLVALRFSAGTSPKSMSRSDYLEWRDRVSVSNQASDTEIELADDRIFKINHRPMPDGGWVATHEDITASKRDELRISYMAHHDELTDLVNRPFFAANVEAAGKNLAKFDRQFALLLLDLDRFKAINDSMGHSAGDLLLQEVARRLKNAVAEGDVVARFGGDEFAILVRDTRIDDEADRRHPREFSIQLAERLIATINEPYVINGIAVGVGTSIGIALAPEHGSESIELLKHADLALYRSKSKGRNICSVFDQQMIVDSNDLLELENDMRSGLKNSEFKLHYQAILDAATRRTVGAEALVRWQHPKLGMLSPARFIPVAEASGLIVPLGEFILKQACKDAARWPDEFTVSVNLSATQFRDPNLFDIIVAALRAADLLPRRLEVEVTESVLLENNAGYAALLHKLKNLGISVALDDFGTGYSSLSYLKQFPFDKIKIDKSFVQDVAESNDSMAIVSAVIGLARGLNMMTTAEGIETERQFSIMRAAGVTLMQGFLFAKPCSTDKFLASQERPGKRNRTNR